ncbi:MAG: hypothetical protein AAGA84_09890 [Pseudomonadota bacterium]
MAEMNLFWLEPLQNRLMEQIRRNQLAHAVLFAGAAGSGKRELASWLAQAALGRTPVSTSLLGLAQSSADFRHLSIAEGKKQLSVDQIRELSGDMSLSSHGGGRKIAVIEPADKMTLAAANSLLKTLEEPPGDALIILVADDLNRLPATILSRTGVLPVVPPPIPATLEWLCAQGILMQDATEALDLAYGAPLAAQAILRSDLLASLRQIRTDLQALWDGGRNALATAAGWRKLDYQSVLMTLRFCAEAVARTTVQPQMRNRSEFDVTNVDSRDAFCYLDSVQAAVARGDAAINKDLSLDNLVQPWAKRFRGVYQATHQFSH